MSQPDYRSRIQNQIAYLTNQGFAFTLQEEPCKIHLTRPGFSLTTQSLCQIYHYLDGFIAGLDVYQPHLHPS